MSMLGRESAVAEWISHLKLDELNAWHGLAMGAVVMGAVGIGMSWARGVLRVIKPLCAPVGRVAGAEQRCLAFIILCKMMYPQCAVSPRLCGEMAGHSAARGRARLPGRRPWPPARRHNGGMWLHRASCRAAVARGRGRAHFCGGF